jgi:hypothetical protein
MNYYKHLDLNFNSVSEKLKKYVVGNSKKHKNFWNPDNGVLDSIPELHNLFEPYKIDIQQAIIIATANTDKTQGIHIDYNRGSTRINIPIINCSNSITNFYRTFEEVVLVNKPNLIYYELQYNHCRLVDSFVLHCPTVMRTDVPHQVVVSPGHTPRISCSLWFEQDISFMLE